MINQTIKDIKQSGLINENDIVFACMETPSAGASFWFGALGASMAMAKAKRFVVSVNEHEIRLFDIDKKTGAYLGTYISLQKNELKKVRAAGNIGAKIILLVTDTAKISLTANNKVKYGKDKLDQKATLKTLAEFLRTNYKTL